MSSVSHDEIKRFSALAQEWWNIDGVFKALHLMNGIRIQYIKRQVADHYSLNDDIPHSQTFQGLHLLDLGCGGGILSIAMRKLGANVLGIDASATNIAVARAYAEGKMLDIDYSCDTAEDLISLGYKFDIICCMEVIEHVKDISSLLCSIALLLSKNGMLFISTINRTIQSYFKVILGAEHILKIVPKGTHQWSKFVKPSQIVHHLSRHAVFLKHIQGLQFDFISGKWNFVPSVATNYIMTFVDAKVNTQPRSIKATV